MLSVSQAGPCPWQWAGVQQSGHRRVFGPRARRRTRTFDFLVFTQALSRLSYPCKSDMVEPRGLEPLHACLQGRCSATELQPRGCSWAATTSRALDVRCCDRPERTDHLPARLRIAGRPDPRNHRLNITGSLGADGGGRTHTVLRPPVLEAGAFASFATSASSWRGVLPVRPSADSFGVTGLEPASPHMTVSYQLDHSAP